MSKIVSLYTLPLSHQSSLQLVKSMFQILFRLGDYCNNYPYRIKLTLIFSENPVTFITKLNN